PEGSFTIPQNAANIVVREPRVFVIPGPEFPVTIRRQPARRAKSQRPVGIAIRTPGGAARIAGDWINLLERAVLKSVEPLPGAGPDGAIPAFGEREHHVPRKSLFLFEGGKGTLGKSVHTFFRRDPHISVGIFH